MSVRGLYAIYDRTTLADDALEAVAAVLAGGACWLQYRDKRATGPDAALLGELRALTRAYDARLIVNDDWRLAQAVAADGVHLGQSDGSLARARAALGEQAIIGISCSGSVERARAGIAEGASYVSFGRFFDSATKPDAPLADPAVLAQARTLGVPVVAIGGIDRDNAADIIAAGADLIAVSGALFHAADSGAAARALAALFQRAG
ncbi:thiamine phosphate synthase [Salinisphaera sp.]|uniref:thiamine phosphate synthase n=1 Tax=Salinisphaera sp. TaxID=1914330 RepID=UPI000C4193DB|nr:thiamine phosphate synthase [Salinisphaera sp.]MBS64044.1 thiamine phosphate synthase [Salinisphaera sp.]